MSHTEADRHHGATSYPFRSRRRATNQSLQAGTNDFEDQAYPFAPPELRDLLTDQRSIIRKFLESELGQTNPG